MAGGYSAQAAPLRTLVELKGCVEYTAVHFAHNSTSRTTLVDTHCNHIFYSSKHECVIRLRTVDIPFYYKYVEYGSYAQFTN